MPEWVPIPPTPMHLIAIANTAEIDSLPEKYPDRATAIVKISVTLEPGGPSRDETMQRLKKMFPRYAEIVFARAEISDSGTPRPGIRNDADYRTTVRNYLKSKHPNDAALLALAETFLNTTEAQP